MDGRINECRNSSNLIKVSKLFDMTVFLYVALSWTYSVFLLVLDDCHIIGCVLLIFNFAFAGECLPLSLSEKDKKEIKIKINGNINGYLEILDG